MRFMLILKYCPNQLKRRRKNKPCWRMVRSFVMAKRYAGHMAKILNITVRLVKYQFVLIVPYLVILNTKIMKYYI